MSMARKRWATLILGLALGVIVVLLAFQGVNLSKSLDIALACRPMELALGGLFFAATLWIRSWRWQVMLAAHQDVRRRSCLSATCVGLLANNILPFRLGDLVRVGAMRQLEGISAARVLGTVAVERVLDVLTLVIFLGLFLAFAAAGPYQSELIVAGAIALAGAVALCVVLIIGYWRQAWVEKLFAKPLGWLSPRLETKVALVIRRFFEGLHVFASPRQFAQVVVLSLAFWGTAVFSYYYVGQALRLTHLPGEYVVVLFATAFGAFIPAAPGSVGTFHGFARLGLFLMAEPSAEAALAFATMLHGIEWLTTNLFGLYFLGRDRLRLLTPEPAGDAHVTPAFAEA